MELGNTKYILQSLITISNAMKKNRFYKTSHAVPTVVIKGKSIESISGMSRHSQKLMLSQSRVLDKLPTIIPCAYNLIDLHLDFINPEALAVALEESVVVEQVKTILLTTVNKLIECFPGGWRKVCT